MKKIIRNILIIMSAALLLVGFSSKEPAEALTEDVNTDVVETVEENLEGHSLMIFCGAGMKDPFEKIAQQFKERTGCDVQVTYANAAQIQTQINTAEEGDFFIAGSKEEVEPVKALVESSKDLVKHIPVLVVAKGNPLGITGPSDLAIGGVKFIMGDPESTPIGKIANKVISDFELTDKLDIVANTATAPAMTLVLESEEANAAIVWKENVKSKNLEIVEITDMNKYIKIIPAALLSCKTDEKAQEIFNKYLDKEEVKAIWMEFGYEIAE